MTAYDARAEWAERYARRGFAVLPLEPADKLPLSALVPHGYQDASADVEQVRAWWRAAPVANIGVVPGRSGLVVLDIDGDAGAATARALAVPTDTATVRTGRGRHLWFRVPPDVTIGNAPLGTGLDVRAHRGYVVAPPSIHPSGRVYAWEPGDGADDLTIAPLPDALLARLMAPPETSGRDEWGGKGPLGVVTCDSPSRPSADVWRRLEAYLQKVPTGLPADSGRKRTAYRLTCVMVHELGISDTQAFAILAAWNGDNHAPLPHRELVRVFTDAKRRGRARWEDSAA